jgi:hypothetical protein
METIFNQMLQRYDLSTPTAKESGAGGAECVRSETCSV